MKIQKSNIVRIILTPILDAFAVFLAFWLAYELRSVTDGIPFVQLRIPYISKEQFLPFVWSGIIIWLLVFARARLYSSVNFPLFDEIRRVMTYGFFWFFVFIGFVYLSQGFLFSKEIPRLIILYVLVFGVTFSLIFRGFLHVLWKFFHKKNFFKKQKILLVQENKNDSLPFDMDFSNCIYERVDLYEVNTIEQLVRSGEIDMILVVSKNIFETKFEPILSLARIYGVSCTYPRILPHMKHFSKQENFIGTMPVYTLSAVSITPWETVLKRILDIFLSLFFIILSFPIMLIVYIGIWLEDNSGPIIYRNRRIGQNGKFFTLYKFRYMYWKYCTKEEYLKKGEKDEGLEYEEQLKKGKNNTRHGPLYKIQNDPRKMKFWGFIERLSLDELPQLFNVLLGNMSLVWPRPHQPREVELYNEADKQVLTIKPWITGMAQVYGRDKNTFAEEVAHDIYYIENYSILLDIMIILRTILVVLRRPFQKK